MKRSYISLCGILLSLQIPVHSLYPSAKKAPTSFMQTIAPQLLLAPAVLYFARALTATEQRFGFAHTMLAGQLATLLAYSWQHQKRTRSPLVAPKEQANKIGYITIHDTITTTEKFHETIKRCTEDENIIGILVNIDAEWGDLSICHAMFQELTRLATKKPLVTLIEKSCCREPYLVATAGHCIIANEHAKIGMIGTSLYFIEQKPDPAKELHYYYAGKLTPLGVTNHHMTPQEQQFVAELIELHYQKLCLTIANQRKLDLQQKNLWAEGRPFLGCQALTAGLIDRVGTLSDAYEAMSELLTKKVGCAPKKFDLIPFTL